MHESSVRRPGHRRLGVWAGLVLLVLATIAPGGVAAGGGNSAAAHRCQMGGWQTLEDAQGHAFTSQSACVSYAANGGSVFSPALRVTVLSSGPLAGSYLWLDLEGSGYHPNSTITLTSELWSSSLVFPTTDASGAWSLTPVGIYCTGYGLASGDSLTASITGTDADGVTATGSFTGVCP